MAYIHGCIPGAMPNARVTLRVVWPIILPASLYSAQDDNNPVQQKVRKSSSSADEIIIGMISYRI
jgi:hypothetical protein